MTILIVHVDDVVVTENDEVEIRSLEKGERMSLELYIWDY